MRLSWSPDGHYLVSAHAMNNSGPTAQIIERDGWKTNMDFVGHRKAVTVVVRSTVLLYYIENFLFIFFLLPATLTEFLLMGNYTFY